MAHTLWACVAVLLACVMASHAALVSHYDFELPAHANASESADPGAASDAYVFDTAVGGAQSHARTLSAAAMQHAPATDSAAAARTGERVLSFAPASESDARSGALAVLLRAPSLAEESRALWFRTVSVADVQALVEYVADAAASTGEAAAGDTSELRIVNGLLQFYSVVGSQAVALTATAAPDVRDSRWHHAAFVRNASSIVLYLDGARVAATTIDAAFLPQVTLLGLGYRPSGAPLPLHGSLDDVRLYDTALAAESIAELAATAPNATAGTRFVLPAAAQPAPAHGLVAHWPCAEGAGAVAFDVAGSERHAFLQRGADWVIDSPSGSVTSDAALSAGGAGALVPAGGALAALLSENNGSATLATWVRSSSSSGASQALLSLGGTGDSTVLLLDASGRAAWELRAADGALRGAAVAGAESLTDGLWHHVAAVREAATVRLYVDGVPVADGVAEASLAAATRVDLGRVVRGTGSVEAPLRGDLAGLRAYAVALSDVDIAALAGLSAETTAGGGLTTAEPLVTTAEAVPTTADAVPTTAVDIPTTAEEIPTTAEQIPTTAETLLTTAEEEIPTTAETLPTTAEALPTTGEALLTLGATTPEVLPVTIAESLPTTAEAVPTTAEDAVTTAGGLLTTQEELLLTTVENLPTTSEDVSGTRTTARLGRSG